MDGETVAEFLIKAGDYKEVSEFENKEFLPFFGDIFFDPGRTYRKIYEIIEDEEDQEDGS